MNPTEALFYNPLILGPLLVIGIVFALATWNRP